MVDCAHNTFVSVFFWRGQITLSELLGGVMTPWTPPRIRHCTDVSKGPLTMMEFNRDRDYKGLANWI